MSEALPSPFVVQRSAARARRSPLPWMLVAVLVGMTAGIFAMGKRWLDDEQQRYAAVLKANSDVQARVKVSSAEQEKLKGAIAAGEESAENLKKQIIDLQEQVQRLQDELARARGPRH